MKSPAIVMSLVALPIMLTTRPPSGPPVQENVTLTLQTVTFDPADGLPPELDNDLILAEPSAGKGRWIVQFRGGLTRDQRELLTSRFQLRLDQYVRHHAFLERLDAETIAAVRTLPFYRADVFYQPAFKISPDIGVVEYRTEYRRSIPGLLLRAILFEDADLDAVAAELAAIPGASDVRTYDDRPLGGVARIVFQLPDESSLAPVARIDAVRWIAEVGEIVNDEKRRS